MLDEARRCCSVEWHLGDLDRSPWNAEFDLVVR
jgi:hypothetical protein